MRRIFLRFKSKAGIENKLVTSRQKAIRESAKYHHLIVRQLLKTQSFCSASVGACEGFNHLDALSMSVHACVSVRVSG